MDTPPFQPEDEASESAPVTAPAKVTDTGRLSALGKALLWAFGILVGGGAIGAIGGAVVTQQGENARFATSNAIASTADSQHLALTETAEARRTDCACPATPTSTATLSPGAPASPEGAVLAYYERLNARDFLSAWGLMTPLFQRAEHEGGFASFVEYWKTRHVEVLEHRPVLAFTNDATVQVRVNTLWEGTEEEDYYEFTLVFSNGGWLIAGKSTFYIWPGD